MGLGGAAHLWARPKSVERLGEGYGARGWPAGPRQGGAGPQGGRCYSSSSPSRAGVHGGSGAYARAAGRGEASRSSKTGGSRAVEVDPVTASSREQVTAEVGAHASSRP